jgi:hypothetical protein
MRYTVDTPADGLEVRAYARDQPHNTPHLKQGSPPKQG